MEQPDIKIEQPKKTWFFEDGNGRIIPVEEKEADSILTVRTAGRRNYKLIGVSDGQTFVKEIQKAKLEIAEKKKLLEEHKKNLNRYIEGHDNLLFKEFAEEDDPRLVRAKKKIEEVKAIIEPLEKEFKKTTDEILKRAETAELEVARGNIEQPRSFRVIQKGDNISGLEGVINTYTR